MDNIIKSKSMGNEQTFSLHCFPHITCESNPQICIEKTTEECFRHINLIQNKSSSQLDNKMTEYEEKTYKQGFMEGEKEGMASAQKKVEPIINNLKQVLLEVEKIKNNIYRNAEKNTVDLAMAIAGKILCHEVSTNEKVVFGVVREAIKKVSDHEDITIKVNPLDYKVLKNPEYNIPELLNYTGNAKIKKDEFIQRGGCIIETGLGFIDATIGNQRQVVEEIFESEIQNSFDKDNG